MTDVLEERARIEKQIVGKSPEDLAAHLRDNLADGYFHQALAEDVFLLAESEGRLIGIVQFGPVRIPAAAAGPEDRELRRIYVLAEFQNQGTGAGPWGALSLVWLAVRWHRRRWADDSAARARSPG